MGCLPMAAMMSTQNPWYASIPMILRTHIITLPWRASPSTKREKGSFFAKKSLPLVGNKKRVMYSLGNRHYIRQLFRSKTAFSLE